VLVKIATGTVVKGTIIVDDPEFKDGTDVFILTREREEEVDLSPEELAELEAGIAEADRGEMIPGDELFARLRRYG
jgi:predicted transcriptional regulator